MTGEIIAAGVIVLVIGLTLFYIIRSKKKGKKCIGCPYGCTCNSKKKCK